MRFRACARGYAQKPRATTSRKLITLDDKKCVFIRERSTHCLYFLQATGTERIELYTVLLAF